jgi:hypothetical protein
VVSRRTRIWRVGKSSPHLRHVPGSAPAFGGALARDDGSDLLSLKLRFFHRRATPFSIPPVFRSFCQLCQAGFPPRRARPFAFPPSNGGIFRRGCPAEARSPCWFAVATRTFSSSGHCVSSAARNTPRILTRPSSGFSSPLAAASPIRIAAPVRPGAGGSVSCAPRATPLPAPFAGSRAHQPHPTFLRFDPELSRGLTPDFLGLRLIRPSIRPWFCQRTRKESQELAAPSIVFLHKLLMVNCL